MSVFPSHSFNDRRGRLKAALAESQSDAIVIHDMINIRYLTGFVSSYGILILSAKGGTLITDGRYKEVAGALAASDLEVICQPISGVDAFFADFFQQQQFGKILFESSLPYSRLEKLREYTKGSELNAEEGMIGKLRRIKDNSEIARIVEAARIADAMMVVAQLYARAGVTEKELSRRIRFASEELGGSGESFSNIVASGPNSSKPHHKPSDRQFQSGDFLTLDLGAIFEGYCSDLTRNPVIGKPSAELERMYAVCLEAQEAAVAACKAGKTGKELDTLAREIITERGYGEYFVHGLGHGVGLEIHENPRLSQSSVDTLMAGDIVTVEPGIYVPGVGGVRIEDLLLVREDDSLVLSHSPKRFTVLR